MALPLLISNKINGIGFALACDLLKEMGYTQYSKPDTHLMEIFGILGLSDGKETDTFAAIEQMAKDCKEIDPLVTPYKIDKVFWLISSGKYYLEKPRPKVVSHKKAFIEWMNQSLKKS